MVVLGQQQDQCWQRIKYVVCILLSENDSKYHFIDQTTGYELRNIQPIVTQFMDIQLSFHPQGNERQVFVFIWRPSFLPTCEASSQQTSISGVTRNAITTSAFGTNFETSYHIVSQSAAFSGVLFPADKCHYALCMAAPWRGSDFSITRRLWAPVPYSSSDSKVRGANMGPIWGRQDPGGPMLVPWTLLPGTFPLQKAGNLVMSPLVMPCPHEQATSGCAKQSVCRWFEKPWRSCDVNVTSVLLHGFVMFLHTLLRPARRAHVVLSQNKRTTFFQPWLQHHVCLWWRFSPRCLESTNKQFIGFSLSFILYCFWYSIIVEKRICFGIDDINNDVALTWRWCHCQ